MAKEFFPISDYKIIEPWLKECYGFSRDMIMQEFMYNLHLMQTTKLTDSDKKLKQKMIANSLRDIQALDVTDYDDENDFHYLCEYILMNSDYFRFDYGQYNTDKIKDIFPRSFFNKLDLSTKNNDYYVLQTINIMSAIYYRYIESTGYFGQEKMFADEKAALFYKSILPDFVNLYMLFQPESKSSRKETVKITYKRKPPITLNNHNNWFLDMFKAYLQEHTLADLFEKISSVPSTRIDKEAIKDRIFREYISLVNELLLKKEKTSGHPENEAYNWILLGTYKLLKYSSIASPKIRISKKETDIISGYLRLLGISKAEDTNIKYRNMNNNIDRGLKEDKPPMSIKMLNPILFHHNKG